MNKLVFVVCPVYTNTPKSVSLVLKAAESIVNQTVDCICLFVDDDSPLDSFTLLQKLGSNRLRFVRRKKQKYELGTASNALNYGFKELMEQSSIILETEKQRITSICYLHCDDVLPSDSLENRLSLMEVGTAFVWGDRLYVDPLFNPIRYYQTGYCNINNILETCVGFSHHTIMWSFDFFKNIYLERKNQHQIDGIYDPALRAFEDVDISVFSFLEAHRLKLTTAYTGKINYLYLVHDQSNTRNISSNEYERCRRYFLRRYNGDTSLRNLYWNPMTSNLPLSLFHFFPEGLKKLPRILLKRGERVLTSGEMNVWERVPEKEKEMIADCLNHYRK